MTAGTEPSIRWPVILKDVRSLRELVPMPPAERIVARTREAAGDGG
jgi:hypothetical protein